MSVADHWMPFYIGDYLADTAHLTTEQHGAYCLILMHMWRRGPILNDGKTLAAVARMSPQRWEKRHADAIMPLLTEIEDVVIQKRLMAERAKVAATSVKRSDAAHESWIARSGATGKAKSGQGRKPRAKPSVSSDINNITSASACAPHMPGSTQPQPQSELSEEREGRVPPSAVVPSAPAGADLLPTATVHHLQAQDQREAVVAWNELARRVDLATVQSMNDTRRRSLVQRLKECGGIAGWRVALDKIAGNPFLLGDSNSGWRISFDALLQRKTFTKLVEGGFDRAAARPRAGRNDWMNPGPVDPIFAEPVQAPNPQTIDGFAERKA